MKKRVTGDHDHMIPSIVLFMPRKQIKECEETRLNDNTVFFLRNTIGGLNKNTGVIKKVKELIRSMFNTNISHELQQHSSSGFV
jgi:hypothetical protein